MSGLLEFAPARFRQGPNVKNTTLWKISKSYFLKTVRKNAFMYLYPCKAYKLILHYNMKKNTMSGLLEFAPARFGQGPNVKNTTLWKISKSNFSKTVPKFIYIYIYV